MLSGFIIDDILPFVIFSVGHVPLYPGELQLNGGFIGHVVLSLHGSGVIRCSFASPTSQSLVLRFLSGSVLASASGRSHGF